jgi:hypothetical protein
LLHDAVEDQGVTDAEIADLFGPTAASLVAEVTDDKNLPKQVRKDKQIADASHKSDGASVIKLADKTSNLLAIANSPPPWPTDRKRTYVEWARAVVSGLPFKPAGLMTRFEEAARLATESIEQQGWKVDEGQWTGLNDWRHSAGFEQVLAFELEARIVSYRRRDPHWRRLLSPQRKDAVVV